MSQNFLSEYKCSYAGRRTPGSTGIKHERQERVMHPSAAPFLIFVRVC
jgi:hypothetical protein